MTIDDAAFNPVSPGADSQGQMIGFTSEAQAAGLLPLSAYDFLIDPIRQADLQDGALFVKRYLQGPQDIWESIQLKIVELGTMWDVTEIDDEYLQYMKRIVGWTPDTDGITDRLDAPTLRKLIELSIAIWKIRGSERAYDSVLTVLLGVNLRIWNWFDLRWILDESALGQDHHGQDIHLLDLPGFGEPDEYTTDIRIVDDTTLDRELVRSVVSLFRPSGERVQIFYIDFLDLFQVDGANEFWESDSGVDPIVVSGGALQLDDVNDFETVQVITELSASWSNYVVHFRLQGTGFGFGALFYWQDNENHYRIAFRPLSHEILLIQVKVNVQTTLKTWTINDPSPEGSPFTRLFEEVHYGLRVHAHEEGVGSLRITVYLDNEEIISALDPAPPTLAGTVGAFAPVAATLSLDEVELFQTPLESDFIDINSWSPVVVAP